MKQSTIPAHALCIVLYIAADFYYLSFLCTAIYIRNKADVQVPRSQYSSVSAQSGDEIKTAIGLDGYGGRECLVPRRELLAIYIAVVDVTYVS